MDAWLTETAANLGRKIESGDIDARDLTEAYLSAIDNHPYRDRIYARTTPDRARAEAATAASRAKLGLRFGPLDGVPISWKDLFDTANVKTEAGTALLAGRTPDEDARVLHNATRNGLVCLGKTHMTELAFSGLGLNPVTASPPNINDHDRVSGGSSSGAATSVAFGLAVAGIGSDTGGSVRTPSAWNNLVGLKTRAGRLSPEGVVPLCARFDTVGPLCRSVEDAALLLAALGGGQPASLEGARLEGVQLARLETSATENLRAPVDTAFEDAVLRLSKAGAQVENIEIPAVAEAMALAPLLFAPEAFGTWGKVIEASPEKMYPPVLERFRGGASVSAPDFIAAWQRLDRLRSIYAAATAGYDAVILPTTPITPPRIEDVSEDPALFTSENLLALQNTRIGNLMGLAGLTLPTGVPCVGLLLQGPSEEVLLRIGVAAERALA